MTAKVIIFDFDGTIADSLQAIIGISNRLALEFGYKQTSQKEIEQFKNLSSKQIINHSGISIFKIPFLLRKVKAELNHQISTINPILGIQQALIELKKQGNRLGIITSNSQENVIAFLEINNLHELFDFTYSGTTIFGKSRVINKVLKQENVKHEDAIYVGDETRDIEAAKKSNIKAIAVSWGFNSKEVLAEHKPNFLIDQPHELINTIKVLILNT